MDPVPHRDYLVRPQPFRLPWCCVLALLLFGAAAALGPWDGLGPTVGSAQDFSGLFPTPRSEGGGGGLLSLNSWLTKAIMVVIAFLAALVFSFFVIFPALLNKKRPAWPLTAYGRCMALVLTVTFGVALFLFWDKLVLGSSSVEVWGGRGLLIFAWIFLTALVWFTFRSPHDHRPAKAT